jgi:hypothetical protein
LVAAEVTGAAGLLPFLLADTSDVIHSLFTYRDGLGVGAGSVWSLTHGSPLESVVQHWDIAAVVAAGVAGNVWLATRPGGLGGSRLFAAMTVSSAGFVLLAKTVWPYYLFEVFVFGTVWAFGRWKPGDGRVRLVLLPLAISTFGMMAEVGSEQGLTQNGVAVEGAGMFAMLALTMAWMLWLSAGPAHGWNRRPSPRRSIDIDGKDLVRTGACASVTQGVEHRSGTAG